MSKRIEGARTKIATKGQIADAENVRIGGDWAFSKKPQFLAERVAIWAELHDKQKETYKSK